MKNKSKSGALSKSAGHPGKMNTKSWMEDQVDSALKRHNELIEEIVFSADKGSLLDRIWNKKVK